MSLLSAAVTGQENSLTVRVGDEVTLPCDIEGDNQDNCDWSFGESEHLVVTGQIDGEAKSDRLNVTHNCALVIKKVTEEDAGFYTCTQIRSGEQSSNLLFVATGEYLHHSVFKLSLLKHTSSFDYSDEDNLTLVVFLSQYLHLQ